MTVVCQSCNHSVYLPDGVEGISFKCDFCGATVPLEAEDTLSRRPIDEVGKCGNKYFQQEGAPYLPSSGLFSLDGRSGRKSFWKVILPVLLLQAAYLAMPVAGWLCLDPVLCVSVSVVMSYLAMVLTFPSIVRRSHDLDWPGWVALFSSLSLFSLPLLLILLFAPGSQGENRYGLPPDGGTQGGLLKSPIRENAGVLWTFYLLLPLLVLGIAGVLREASREKDRRERETREKLERYEKVKSVIDHFSRPVSQW